MSYTFRTEPGPPGHTLYCATTDTGFQSCIMDQPTWWDPLKQQQAQTAADPAPATFAWNTTESHTGGGGALELGMLLVFMGALRARRRG